MNLLNSKNGFCLYFRLGFQIFITDVRKIAIVIFHARFFLYFLINKSSSKLRLQFFLLCIIFFQNWCFAKRTKNQGSIIMGGPDLDGAFRPLLLKSFLIVIGQSELIGRLQVQLWVSLC